MFFYGAVRGAFSLLQDVAYAADNGRAIVDFLASGLGNLLVVVGGLLLMLWAVFTQPREFPVGEGAEESEVAAERPTSPQGRLSDSVFRERTIYIGDLGRENGVIVGRTFDRCMIYGPAVLAAVGERTFENCTWEGRSDAFIVRSPEGGRLYVGPLYLRECFFRKCHFVRIGLLVSPEEYEPLKKAVAGE